MRSIRSSSLACDRLEVHEVEAQPIGRHQRARLLDVRAEHLAQRRVQKVGRGVVAPRRVADSRVDFGGDDVADRATRRASTRTRCARGTPAPDADHPFDGRRAAGRC